jgi:tetratricopeptide (TPR) repeat protein
MLDSDSRSGEGILVPFEGGGDPLLQAFVALERAVVLADGRHFYEAAVACDAILAMLDGPGPLEGDPRCSRLRAQAWVCKGRALDGAGHHAGALTCLERALAQWAPAASGEVPGSSPVAGECARALSLKAAALSHLGRPGDALDIHRQAVSELRLLVARQGQGELAQELARALTRLGAALIAAGRAGDAECALDEAIPIFDRLVFESWRDDLASELDGALQERVEARGEMEG